MNTSGSRRNSGNHANPDPIPYARLLRLRARMEELDTALAQREELRSFQFPRMALRGLRVAVAAELEKAEEQWRTRPRSSHRQAA